MRTCPSPSGIAAISTTAGRRRQARRPAAGSGSACAPTAPPQIDERTAHNVGGVGSVECQHRGQQCLSPLAPAGGRVRYAGPANLPSESSLTKDLPPERRACRPLVCRSGAWRRQARDEGLLSWKTDKSNGSEAVCLRPIAKVRLVVPGLSEEGLHRSQHFAHG
jgi:hypothetical protein